MSKRPISITVIAWLMIVIGGIFLVKDVGRLPGVKGIMIRSPIYIFQLIFSYVIISFALISGIGILARQNWARFLYLICWIINFIIFLIYSQPITTNVIVGIILFLITIYFLFNPKANEYFDRKNSLNAAG
jgi:hypothetical protein